MTTYNTGNPIGSAEVKDLYDNAENLDIAINSPSADVWTDRLGQARKTWRGIQNEAQLEIAQVVGEVTAQSQQYLDASIVARDEARAAASASGPIAFFGTYAAAQAAVGGLPDGGIVEVSQDETRAGARTRYKVQAGVLAFALNLDQTRLDLASDADPLKGAALVGDKGTSVSRALALDKRKPRKLFSKLFAAASAPAHIRYVLLGDSLANFKMQQISASLDRRIGGQNISRVNTAGDNGGAGIASGGSDCYPTTTVSYTAETGKYEYWPTGIVHRLDAGGSCGWITGGGNPYFTDVKVYYVKEPGAGTINLVVNGATVATASADAAAGLGVLTHTKAYGQASVSTTVTGAAVRVLFTHTRATTISGLDQYGSMATGGLLLANATSSAQGRAIWQAAIADIAPDFLSFEMDDDFGTGSATNTALDYLATILDAACPNADKVIIASTPRAANDAGKLAASNYLKGFCGGRNASWLFFDSYYLMGSYAEMVAIFGADDGVHPVAAAEAYAAEILWEFLGLDGFNLGYVSRAVNDPGTPSKLARNTIFQGPGIDRGVDVTVETDGSFGYDWTIKFPRTLTFATRGSYGSMNGTGWQFSGNTAVNPHIMPLNLDFISAGNVRKLSTSTSSGYEFTQFKKTDNPGGGLMHLQTGLIRSGFTRAELLAIYANQVVGAIAFCSDCTGGAQWVYARGTGVADWVTVDGKTAI